MRALVRRGFKLLQQIARNSLRSTLMQGNILHLGTGKAKEPFKELQHVSLVRTALLPINRLLERRRHKECSGADSAEFSTPPQVRLGLLQPILQTLLGLTLRITSVIRGFLETEHFVDVAHDAAERQRFLAPTAHLERWIGLERVVQDGVQEPPACFRFTKGAENRAEDEDALIAVAFIAVIVRYLAIRIVEDDIEARGLGANALVRLHHAAEVMCTARDCNVVG